VPELSWPHKRAGHGRMSLMPSSVRVATFSWNLHEEPEQLTRAAQHLDDLPSGDPFVACLQELPAEGVISKARRLGSVQPPTYDVVQTERLVPGCAIVHHRSLELIDAVADVDWEFVAARFKLGSETTLRVVCIHAESRMKLIDPEARGGARALLRNAIALLAPADHTLLMGDFNSHYAHLDISGYNAFYALNPHVFPVTGESNRTRRAVPHPAWHVVVPDNGGSMGTYRYSNQFLCLDFMVVSESLAADATCTILTEIARERAFDASARKILLSDHLPIAGSVTISS